MGPRRFLTLMLFIASAPVVASPHPAAGTRLHAIESDIPESRVYIVQLQKPAAVTARRGSARRFDAQSPAVKRYAERLTASHDAVLDSVGAADAKLYSYRYALNGFAARMTPAQARKLRLRKDVRAVWEDRPKFVETNDSPGFLGLTATSGGLRRALGLRGEGIVIGVIDSGIAPGHPSFSDTKEAKKPRLCKSEFGQTSLLGRWLCKRFKSRQDTVVYSTPTDWQGSCEAGERFLSTYCNHKLIGARYYINGFLEQYDLDANEFISPRDADGHGTHIASTAAGNFVKASLAGRTVATIAGMAPRAHVAVYKACWLEPGQLRGTCSTADLTEAIESAVADGVDIINYSVGSNDDINDADDLALLAASDAGVLTVAAAGNEGPAPGSMLSPAAAPWVLAVGASSRRGERFREAIRVNSPAAVKKDYAALEAGFTPRLRDQGPFTLELVLVDDATLGSFDGVAGTAFDGCEALVNGADVTGQIALVQRGGCDFQTKILNAQNAGAEAVVVYNNQGEPILMTGTRDSVAIPALMIGQADGELLRERLVADETVQVTLDKAIVLTVRDDGNQMQGFSARGPSVWEPKILKPDVTAPGVDILAGQTPDVANNVRGERFQYLSGTSMAVPHVTGIAALLKEAHPDWSPAALKSAIVTTARQNVRKEDGDTAADPFDFGGGHVSANAAVSPGLVYDAGTSDYDAFLCGRGDERLDVDCAALEAAGFATAASDLNQPSLALDDLVSEQILRRRVTNVGGADQFTASVELPSAINVDVTPAVLSLGAGESADVEIRLSTGGTITDAWQFGALTWAGSGSTVRSPLAVRALPFDAPVVAFGDGATGSLDLDLRVGYTGSYVAVLSGIEVSGQSQTDQVRALLTGAIVTDDPDDTYEFVQPTTGDPPDNVTRIPIVVPAGTRYLRVALFDEETNGGHDLDLYLYSCPGFGECTEEATPAVGDSSDEAINLIPAAGESFITAGEYYVDVHGFEAAGGTATFNLFVWTVGADRGNAVIAAPASVAVGTPARLSLDWQNLPTGRNLGLIVHSDGTTVLDQTVVEITVP